MHKLSTRLLMATIASSALLAFGAFAQDINSPVGLWKNIDDHSGKPKALIRITESNGELRGKIEKLLRDPSEDQNPKCVKCEGALKDQPILGMTIITGMKHDGDEYNGGQILDPDNGKVYKSKMSLTDGGKKLNVRGYIGVPLLGRTQTWLREE
ncbi:hypothetical protein CAter282_0676 [Collimonas arenae]|uniref:DUF2147 domain-containing protein n=2 Tax=Collimonas arenae TaxID=279058 RepID=A0A127QEJ6_9BURK|nr:DUF2147 domain-containing protein [Collimonas arenae]AMO98594.1 hypothetical protein CAter10_0725 [Collimonas arenae]AMP08479.1 hypothetical protein CAter282_0676 [Collimonas arenae]